LLPATFPRLAFWVGEWAPNSIQETKRTTQATRVADALQAAGQKSRDSGTPSILPAAKKGCTEMLQQVRADCIIMMDSYDGVVVQTAKQAIMLLTVY
jgi:hypothetical protein